MWARSIPAASASASWLNFRALRAAMISAPNAASEPSESDFPETRATGTISTFASYRATLFTTRKNSISFVACLFASAGNIVSEQLANDADRFFAGVSAGESATNMRRDKPIRAAEYLRMSTEHQRYSIANQAFTIRAYAASRGFEIVKTYADEARSGLTLEGRSALQRLLDDAKTGRADFDAVLVYDVSRWGRFQDPDEAAVYEMYCRRAGISLHYCAEQFENDGSVGSSIIKALKRAMAAEYSRELSAKVYAGQARLAKKGFKLGGLSPYGFRRLLVDHEGRPKFELEDGQHKGILTDRVVLVPGSDTERGAVRKIFELFVERRMRPAAIARHLNEMGVPFRNRRWAENSIRYILKSEVYAGHHVWARRSTKLHNGSTYNAPEAWVRCDHAYIPIIEQELFDRAQSVFAENNAPYTRHGMLEHLREILAREGRLSALLINNYPGPCQGAFVREFGSLANAYAAVGFRKNLATRYLPVRRRLKDQRPQFVQRLVEKVSSVGVTIDYDADLDRFTVNSMAVAAFFVLHCVQQAEGHLRWPLRLDEMMSRSHRDIDILIIQRLDESNTTTLDYYVIPRSAFNLMRYGLNRTSIPRMEKWRHQELQSSAFDVGPYQPELFSTDRLMTSARIVQV